MPSLPTYPLINFVARQAFRNRLKLHSGRHTLPTPASEPVALYIHIPFCESLCTYCTFHRQLMDETLARAYFQALRKEIQQIHQAGWRVGHIYFGGGTPTILIDELSQTLALTNRLFHQPVTSVETNPNHLIPDVLQPLQDAGVARLSVGIQSLDRTLLTRMNRLPVYGEPNVILQRLQEANERFATVNADMIFNLPGQTEASLRYDLNQLQKTQLRQISWYPLMPNHANRKPLAESLGDYTRAREWRFYRLITSQLDGQYQPSSAWCFNLLEQNATDEYFVNYRQYLGLGSGSFSYVNRTLYASSFSIRQYIQCINDGQSPLVASQRFTDQEWLLYQMLLQLFGLKVDKTYSGSAASQMMWRTQLQALRAFGALKAEDGQWHVTLRGQYLGLVLMREFFTAVNRLREQMQALNGAENRITAAQL